MKLKLKKIINWIDENILLILSGFLLAFIPLYPKLPLFDAIPGYIVRVRLEDIFVLFTAFIWLIQLLRKKIKWNTPFFLFILLYAVIGLLSLTSAIFLTKTIPQELLHIGKSGLHYFRYLEYFALFLIVFSSIKTHKHIKVLISTLLITLVLVSAYGYGQKYWYWPVYSTMNREFSKGLKLYLTEHARVQSTFGGHYDFAAFLVILLPIALTLAFKTKNNTHKIVFHLIHLAGLWSMVVSASRTSFLAYLASAGAIIIILSLQEKRWINKFKSFFSKSFLMGLIVVTTMVFFGDDMHERLLQVLEGYPKAWKTYHVLNDKKKVAVKWVLITTGLKEPEKPKDGISLDEAIVLESVLVPSDERPTTSKPSDVYVDVPDIIYVASISAQGENIVVEVERDRTWSDNAHKFGLSLGIRLDTLWPRAISGFMRNPLLGSGYATLNKEGVTHFTEAESTDNNFLRTLGETGLLGFITFYGLVFMAIKIAFKQIKNKSVLISGLALGFIGSSIGLLLNAVYIDVFAASKVAFTYWGMTGIVVASYYFKKNVDISIKKTPIIKNPKPKSRKKKFKNI
jgi:hypothetical protein